MSLQHFLEYAQAFELTYDDDDWSRLERFFAPDAVYQVRNVAFACRLEGPAAILRGIRRSLDGFDRRLPKRTLALTQPPTVDGDQITIVWTATYTPPAAAPLVLRGRTTARFRDGLIAELTDDYADDMKPEIEEWTRAHGSGFDPAYV